MIRIQLPIITHHGAPTFTNLHRDRGTLRYQLNAVCAHDFLSDKNIPLPGLSTSASKDNMRPATTTARVLSRNRATARPPISRIHILGEASSSRLIRPRVASVSASALSRASTSTRRHASTTSNLAHPHGVDKESVEGANPPMPGPSNLPASTDLLEVYRGMVAQGRLAWDEEQVRIVMKVSHAYQA